MATSTTNRWKLGLFVLVSFFTMLAVAVWLGSRRFQSETLMAYVYFDEPVTGLDVGSPVRFRGMTIGSIAGIRVAQDRHHLEVACSIDVQKLEQIGLRDPGEIAREGAQIPPTMRAQIERSFVTGVAFVQTDFFDPLRYPAPRYPFEVPETVVHAAPSPQKSLQTALDQLGERLPELLDRADGLMATLNDTLARAEVPALSEELRLLLAELRTAIGEVRWTELDAGLGRNLDALRGTLADLRTLVADEGGPLRQMIRRADRAIENLDGALAGADLPATAAALRGLLAGYSGLAPELAAALPGLRRTIDALRRLAEVLERDPAALLRGRATPNDPRTSR
jgi:paraquat-inducible protein B